MILAAFHSGWRTVLAPQFQMPSSRRRLPETAVVAEKRERGLSFILIIERRISLHLSADIPL